MLTKARQVLRRWTLRQLVFVRRVSRYRHSDIALLINAAMIGVVVGGIVVIFHLTTEWAERVFKILLTQAETTIPMRILAIPLVCGLGGLGVGFLNATLFKNVEGEGIQTVTYAVHRHHGFLDWRLTAKAILTAAFSIGSGGGAGREGPTVLLGASLGSSGAQLLQLGSVQRQLLCVAGTAAAISGIFNAPLGGIVFALEVIWGELSARSFIPIVIASVLATATARIFMGNSPMIIAPPLADIRLQDYFLMALLGIACGATGLYFLKTYHWCFRKIQQLFIPIHPTLRPALGGVVIGLILVALPTMLETTYTPINQAIQGKGTLWIALATVLVKPVSNAITLGSGGAGGTFAPVMKVGAMLGLCFGLTLNLVFPNTPIGLYALVGAGALIGSTFSAPLAGAIILFEISRNYTVLLPLLFASVFAHFIVHRIGIPTFNPLALPQTNLTTNMAKDKSHTRSNVSTDETP